MARLEKGQPPPVASYTSHEAVQRLKIKRDELGKQLQFALAHPNEKSGLDLLPRSMRAFHQWRPQDFPQIGNTSAQTLAKHSDLADEICKLLKLIRDAKLAKPQASKVERLAGQKRQIRAANNFRAIAERELAVARLELFEQAEKMRRAQNAEANLRDRYESEIASLREQLAFLTAQLKKITGLKNI